MMTISPGYFELAIDQSPRPFRGVGLTAEISDFLIDDWICHGYLVSANGGVPTASKIALVYAIGRQPVDHLDAVKGGAIVGSCNLDWSQGPDVIQDLSPTLEHDTAVVERYEFDMRQSEMTDV